MDHVYIHPFTFLQLTIHILCQQFMFYQFSVQLVYVLFASRIFDNVNSKTDNIIELV